MTRDWCQAGTPDPDATEADYQACVGGSLTTQTACLNPGAAAPADAFTSTQQWCDGGTTRNRTVCVDPGDSPPSDTPCTSCPSGQRLVGLNCLPCPDYQVCSGGSLGSQQWCGSGSPPADATTASYQACVSGSITALTACLNPGDSAPADATTAAQQWCDSGTTRSRTVCVNPGDSPPADAPCSTCPGGQRLIGLNCQICPDYQACVGGALTPTQYCGSGSTPTDATTVSYQACSSNSLVTQTACLDPGATPPSDGYTVSVQWCDAGTTRSRNVCVDAGDSPPADAPCSTCPSGQRLIG